MIKTVFIILGTRLAAANGMSDPRFEQGASVAWDGEFVLGTQGANQPLFANFAALEAAGWVARHSVLVTSGVFMDGFVGPADETLRHDPPDFALAVSSSALDRGQRLPGTNDGFTGVAPDLGALEAGCPVATYGPRPEGLEHATWLVNCDGGGQTASARQFRRLVDGGW